MRTTATALSIQKTATLLQNLVDLKTQTPDIAFPSDIDMCVTELLYAQTAFVKRIDKYMHRGKRDVNEVETVKVIIETCPDFMATKDEFGYLPIHWSTYDSSSSCIFVPLLADMGRRHGIGAGGRGGLLADNNDISTLELITTYSSPDAYKALMNVEPPLFYKQDIHDCCLLHRAVSVEKIEVVKFLVELDASCLYSCDEDDQMPIACSYSIQEQYIGGEVKMKRLEILQYLLKAAFIHDAKHPSIGGLFSKDRGDNDIVLKHLINKLGEEDTWDCIHQALSRFDVLPILHQVILRAPQYCSATMTRFPDSVLVRDNRNRLPIHVALASGMNWSLNLVAIINANRSHLKENDPVTGWPPFALAAMEPSCGLRTSCYLLNMHPEHGQKIGNHNDNLIQERNSNGKRKRIHD